MANGICGLDKQLLSAIWEPLWFRPKSPSVAKAPNPDLVRHG